MKTIKYFIRLTIILVFTTIGLSLYADNPPNPPGSHGSSGDEQPAGGGAPIGSGTAILVSLVAVYGGSKYLIKKNKNELIDEDLDR